MQQFMSVTSHTRSHLVSLCKESGKQNMGLDRASLLVQHSATILTLCLHLSTCQKG